MDALVSGIMLLPAPNLLVASGLHRQPRSAVFVGFNSAEALSRGKPALERTFKMGSDDVGRGADQQHRFEVLLGVERFRNRSQRFWVCGRDRGRLTPRFRTI